VAAASDYAQRSGLEIASYVIGPGREVLDTYDDWSRLSEVEEEGCVLVRPDSTSAGAAATLPADPRRTRRAGRRAAIRSSGAATGAAA
jgi:2,4-dichlorophenol 6-monooxygenase